MFLDLVPIFAWADVRITRNNTDKQRHIAVRKLSAFTLCFRKQSITSVNIGMSASNFQQSINVHFFGKNQCFLWDRRIGSSKKHATGFIKFACKHKTSSRIGCCCQHPPSLLLIGHSQTACLDGHIWPKHQMALNALSWAWILRRHVRLNFLKIISVIFSFRLSIDVGSRSESSKMSKIQFQFSVFIHRLWPQ